MGFPNRDSCLPKVVQKDKYTTQTWWFNPSPLAKGPPNGPCAAQ